MIIHKSWEGITDESNKVWAITFEEAYNYGYVNSYMQDTTDGQRGANFDGLLKAEKGVWTV